MAIHVEDLRFRYQSARFQLSIDDLEVASGEPTAIIGPSGCGKTTLLRLMAGILRPAAGRVEVLAEDVAAMDESRARAFRARNVGLVFQEFELLEYLTAEENILLPFRVCSGLAMDASTREILGDLARHTGIAHLLGALPRRLSQGERQRVAICRALVTQPRIVFADEPTGSLDPTNQERIVALLRSTTAAAGADLIMVTHDHQLLSHFARVIDLPDVIAIQS